LAATVRVTVELPPPEVAEALTHAGRPVTVHEHPPESETRKLKLPPATAAVTLDGETVNQQEGGG
jgi:hypothetical protein